MGPSASDWDGCDLYMRKAVVADEGRFVAHTLSGRLEVAYANGVTVESKFTDPDGKVVMHLISGARAHNGD